MLASRAVLTNGHTGHVPMAPGFFFFLVAPTGCGEIIFFKLIVKVCVCRTQIKDIFTVTTEYIHAKPKNFDIIDL